MAKSKGETQRGPICTPMARAPYTAISTHGNTKTTMETANGLTQAAMVNIKATPEGISSPMGTVFNFKKSIAQK